MEEQEIERLLKIENEPTTKEWNSLKWIYKNTFGKPFWSKCKCNAPKLIASVKKAKGYAH